MRAAFVTASLIGPAVATGALSAGTDFAAWTGPRPGSLIFSNHRGVDADSIAAAPTMHAHRTKILVRIVPDTGTGLH